MINKSMFMFLVLVSLIFACTYSEAENYEDKVDGYLRSFKVSAERGEYLIVVNIDACSSCLLEVREFIENNAHNKNLILALVSHSSKKINRLTGEVQGEITIIRDAERRAVLNYGLIGLNPRLYELTDETVRAQTMTIVELSNYIF